MKISPVEPPRGTDAPLVLWGRFGRFAQAPWTRLRISAAGLPYPGLPVTGKIDELDHPRCLYNLSRLSRTKGVKRTSPFSRCRSWLDSRLCHLCSRPHLKGIKNDCKARYGVFTALQQNRENQGHEDCIGIQHLHILYCKSVWWLPGTQSGTKLQSM